MKKILLISPDAHMGGGQILLLTMGRALKETGNVEVEFLLKHGGALEHEFRELAPTFLFYRKLRKTIKSRVKQILIKEERKDISTLSWKSYDAVLCNTITNGDIIEEIRSLYKGPIATYVHELHLSAKTFSNEKDVANVIALSDHFMVPCQALRKFLETEYNVSSAKISVLPYYVPLKNEAPVRAEKKQGDFMVGAAGTTDWRKGPELFIQVAAAIKNRITDKGIKFIWKGSNTHGLEHAKLMHDVSKLGLDDMVSFEPPVKKLATFFESLDVFLLTSREDPYPLVVLDAANHSVPTVCFKDAGGIPEFIEKSGGGGISVEYMNIEKTADAVLQFYHHAEERKNAGILAKKYLTSVHQDAKGFCKELQNIYTKINQSLQS